MLRTIWWMIYFWGFLILTYPKLRKIDKLDKTTNEHTELVSHYVRRWAYNLLKIAGTDVLVIGEENLELSRQAVFVSNHQGSFDVPLMLAHVGKPRALLSKIEVEKMPLVSNWMNNLHCFYVDRKNPKQALKVVINAIKYVKAGGSLTIFPEGTRSKSDNLGEFKSGSTKIAIKADALIVPVTINGSYKILEQNNGFRIKPAKVIITIHNPLDPRDMSKEEIDNIDNNLYNIINSVLPK